MKILVGCALVPHKMGVFDIFMRSILDQTISDFDMYFIWGHRTRSGNINEEELLRAEDIDSKEKKIWEKFRTNQYDYLWMVDTDTYYPPNTLETMIKKSEEGYDAVGQECHNAFGRGLYGYSEEVGEWHITDWGGASELFNAMIRDKCFPRWEIVNGKVIKTQEQCIREDLWKNGLRWIIIKEPLAWHLCLDCDMLPNREMKVRGGLPEFLGSYRENIWERKFKE